MAALAEGLTYRRFTYHDSLCHLLEIDLTKRSVRPVLAAEAFPFKMCRPLPIAIEQGALASVGGGFNLLSYHHQGVTDQPLHALAVDGELWTDGVGAGGIGLLIGDGLAYVQQNRIQVHVWNRGDSVEVDSVNLHHASTERPVVAFTQRAAPVEFLPQPEKEWTFLATRPSRYLESDQPLPFAPEEWKQDLGQPDVRHIVSGWPQIVRNGENAVKLMNLDPEAPHGPDNWFLRVGPRMALGTSEDHRTVFMLTVEGRSRTSKGLRLKALANVLIQHGVHDATNLDGGGSAWMWTRHGGLVSDSCYGDGTIDGLRPDHYVCGVF